MSGDVHRVRLDPETHRRLKVAAAERGLTIKEMVRRLAECIPVKEAEQRG